MEVGNERKNRPVFHISPDLKVTRMVFTLEQCLMPVF